MAERDDDELDLNLSNLDAGLRLVSSLIEQCEPPELRAGMAFLVEKLVAEAAAARGAYDVMRLGSMAAAQGRHHDTA